ncbi:hypothetical protein LIER_07003 [Lithospermum erythrorhizon]|uniref:Transmembrane protein n=1 Tax=Lithospermum erythrorhizon TaxID=34254 RepID=A0AAV3PAW6_LITER
MNLISPSAPTPPTRTRISSTHHHSLKFSHPIPPLFSKSRFIKLTKPIFTVCNAIEPTTTTPPSTSPENNPISLVGQEDVPLEGVIQFEKPACSSPYSLINKWGRVALLAGGDVLALLLFSAIGRFSHGFSVFDLETLKTADPFIAGWFLSAYFLGGYSEDGRGMNGFTKAVTAAVKSWSLGIPLGLVIRTAAVGHIPPINFMLVTMGSTAVLLIGWRSLLYKIIANDEKDKDDVYKRGNPFELFELLSSLVRRW